VTFRNYVNDAELVEAYRRAKVVVQASYHEGFGCALAEAMSFGCVPVVTRRGALPEVVGDTGYYVEYGDVQALGSAIAKALEDWDKAFAASKRARALFTIDERRKRLFELVETLADVNEARTLVALKPTKGSKC
jgi:glycosyltransferase involved in cell wall biosynthesis